MRDKKDFSAFANAKILKKINELKKSEYVETAIIDFAALERDFFDLLDALNIDTLTILIDEWSSLDRRFSPISQVYFAEYLKRCFFGTHRICVKISAIEHETLFASRIDANMIGLEIGGDIFDDVNLDEIYNNRVMNLKNFFSELIFKRLKHCDIRIRIFEDHDENNVS